MRNVLTRKFQLSFDILETRTQECSAEISGVIVAEKFNLFCHSGQKDIVEMIQPVTSHLIYFSSR